MTLQNIQQAQGAVFQEDHPVPVHYGDPAAAYRAAHEAAILVDRSDQALLEISGADRLTIINRMSTNAVLNLSAGEGAATVLTTPSGRIIDRVILYNLDDEHTLVRGSAGRAAQLADYLRRNVFFREKMQVEEIGTSWAQLMVYGPQAAMLLTDVFPGVAELQLHHVLVAEWDAATRYVVAADPPGVPGYGIVVPGEQAAAVWQALIEQGSPHGIRPAGLETMEVLRVEAGLPGPRGELNEEYLPLEAGLWPDVSFSKGCYTGQEIIARLESRGKLAKTLIGVTLSGPVAIGTAWFVNGRQQGTVTSVVQHPDGQWLGLGFVRPDQAEVGQQLVFEDGTVAVIRYVATRPVLE